MNLNHINLVVSNVADVINLFEKFFGFNCISIKGDHAIAILSGPDDFTLVLMADPKGTSAYPGAFHIGLLLDQEGEVTETYNKLKAGGIEVGQEPRKIRDGFGFYFNFDHLMIEVGLR